MEGSTVGNDVIDEAGCKTLFGPQLENSGSETAVELFASWRRNHQASSILCRLQQRLESKGLLRARNVRTPAKEVRNLVHAQALDAEALAMTAVLKLQDLIPGTPAKSLLGVIAKLEMIVGADREIGDPTDFPWPHLASVLDDLRAIAGDVPFNRMDRRETRALVNHYLDAARESQSHQGEQRRSLDRYNSSDASAASHPQF